MDPADVYVEEDRIGVSAGIDRTYLTDLPESRQIADLGDFRSNRKG